MSRGSWSVYTQVRSVFTSPACACAAAWKGDIVEALDSQTTSSHCNRETGSASGGMNGSLLPTAGEPCPAVVPAPYSLGEDIMANSVCCACFRNPPHQRHTPRLLEGQAPEARALHLKHSLAVLCS